MEEEEKKKTGAAVSAFQIRMSLSFEAVQIFNKVRYYIAP